jgi:hypothetical protein
MGYTSASAGRMRRLHEVAHNHRGNGARCAVESHRLRRHDRIRLRGNLGLLLGGHAHGIIDYIRNYSRHANNERPYKSPHDRERYSFNPDAY